MDWLINLFSGPYPAISPVVIAVPLALGVLAVMNRSEKERNRKGWHPVTKAAVLFFGIFLALVAGVWALT